MNRLSTEKRVQILYALCEGASINATARQTGASKVTILKLLAEVGTAVLAYQQRVLVNLPCKRIEADEIWSFVGAREKNVPLDEKGRGRGDCWTWTGICADTKLIPCWHVGTRDADAAHLFMEELASRLANRVQLSTDGHNAYLTAVENAFGWNGVDYAMLVKLYGATGDTHGSGKYAPVALTSLEKKPIMGQPDEALISTSYAESHNTRMRTNIRRLTRLTNGHSKKIENHVHAMSLWFMYYNFCRPHMTLTKNNGGIKQTPAMAAGVSDHVWNLGEVVALLAS
ncbi:MAG TPA: IS1 family transposase [Gemmatimonadaceae bacterium]|nr:IS1 family transposase [Gemmatimonadaceae bacterium]